ncbi:MAG TPA: twin-arginine translocase TatA/TatE family subunit [Actinomycetota bacterium]
MPNLGFGEIIVILLVALLVFGPRRLPEIGRTVGKSLREFRRATTNLKAEFEQDLDVGPPRRTPARRRRPPTANGETSERAPGEEPEPETGGPPE